MALVVRPTRLLRSAIVLKPSILLGLHKALSKQKYRLLFSTNRRRKPGPKGPSAKLIRAVVQMKQRNPNWRCPRIAQQIALAFHIQIDKDVVRRILARHPSPGRRHRMRRGRHPRSIPQHLRAWLCFLGKSLMSYDLKRNLGLRPVIGRQYPPYQLAPLPLSGSNKGHDTVNLQYSCGLVGCHLRRKVVEFAVSHETHNPKVSAVV
jgi:hypothetical protein